MNKLILNENVTMSSRELLDVINNVREQEGENSIRSNDFHARVADELSDFNYETFVVQNLNKTESVIFKLTQDMCMLVAMRESKKVRRAVLEILKGKFKLVPDFNNPAEAARAWADQYDTNIKLLAANQEQIAKIESLESLFVQGETIFEFCKKLNGVNANAVNRTFELKNWLYNESKSTTRWRVKSYARDRYLTEETGNMVINGIDCITHKPVLLKKGAVRIYEMYLKNELPMKKDWNGSYTQDKHLGVA